MLVYVDKVERVGTLNVGFCVIERGGTMEAKMVTVEMPVQVYSELQSLASHQQEDVVETLWRLIVQAREQTDAVPGALTRILDRAADLGVTDLAEAHDHYLYGVDKA